MIRGKNLSGRGVREEFPGEKPEFAALSKPDLVDKLCDSFAKKGVDLFLDGWICS